MKFDTQQATDRRLTRRIAQRGVRYVGTAWKKFLLRFRTRAYLQSFTLCGPAFQPLGPAHIVNEGLLIAGASFTFRSFRYLPVQIRVHTNARLKIGDNVFLNQGVRISCSQEITIGDDCLLGDEVLVIDNDWHSVGNVPIKKAAIVIESHTWIAARSIILKGVTVGTGSVVAAGSVVTHSVPPFTLVGGVPAKPIRTISRSEQVPLEQQGGSLFDLS